MLGVKVYVYMFILLNNDVDVPTSVDDIELKFTISNSRRFVFNRSSGNYPNDVV